MKKRSIVITWCDGFVGEEPCDWYVVVSSKPPTASSSKRARMRYEREDFVRALVPQIFLDESLDSPALRTFLRAEAERRKKIR